ncbi:MAG: conjugal transfer protein TraF [Pseudomonadota bacterium]
MRIILKLYAIMSVFASVAHADASLGRLYCGDRALGVYFYCERPDPSAEEFAAVGESGASTLSATKQAERITAEVKEARALAVLKPTPQNVSAYIRLQREQLDRASLFTEVWQRVIWAEPELDYTLERPVGQLAKRVWLADRNVARRTAVEAAAGRYGLFYFYSSTCSACQAFSPVLRAFADAHGLVVRAVSVDGGPDAYFPDAVIDRGQMAEMGLGAAPTPAVALFDADTRDVLPVAFGVVSAAELADRIYLLTSVEPGDDL